jgi:hypothetical protein
MSSHIPTREELQALVIELTRYSQACHGIIEADRIGWKDYGKNPMVAPAALWDEINPKIRSTAFIALYGWPDDISTILDELRFDRPVRIGDKLQYDRPVHHYRGDKVQPALDRLDSLVKQLSEALSAPCSDSIEVRETPVWNADLRILSYRGTEYRRFPGTARVVIEAFNAFQSSGWTLAKLDDGRNRADVRRKVNFSLRARKAGFTIECHRTNHDCLIWE